MKNGRILAAVLVSSALVACSGPKHEVKVTAANAAIVSEFDGAPDWVQKGCMTKFGSRKDILCGVGGAAGTRNIPLARDAAVARGRTELARSLQVMVQSMLKDYQATTTGGEAFGEAANDEQHIENVSRQITDISLSGTRLEDTWISKNGTLYALVIIDIEAFKGAVSRMGQLNEQVRQAVEQRAQRAFEDLDRQLGRSE
jgi:hypothetical protein